MITFSVSQDEVVRAVTDTKGVCEDFLKTSQDDICTCNAS